MARRLVNPVESLDNAERSKKHTSHGTWIGKLIPEVVRESLGALRKA